MTQLSWPWSTDPPSGGPGDGAAGLGEDDARKFLSTYFGVADPTQEGVCKGVLDELELTGDTSPVTVAAGAAICLGLYYSDAPVNLAVATPTTGATGGRVVLRTNFAGTSDGSVGEAQTRLAVKLNTDGNSAAPALTQNAGTTWEVPLWSFQITTGGVIDNVTDERVWRRWSGGLLADTVDSASIQDEAVGGAHIEAGAISAPHIDEGIPTLVSRRGGNASNWRIAGSTLYPTEQVHMVAGVLELTMPNGSYNATATVSLAGTALEGQEGTVLCNCWIEEEVSTNRPSGSLVAVKRSYETDEVRITGMRSFATSSTTTLTIGYLVIGEA